MTNPSRPNRFGGLKALKDRGDVPATGESPAPSETHAVPPQIAQEPAKEPQAEKVQASRPRPQRGAQTHGTLANPNISGAERIPGKSRRDDYRSTTIYVRAEVHADATDKLRSEERGKKRGEPKRDMSDVIDALLAGWVAGRFKL